MPEEIRFVNEQLDKGGLQKLVAKCYQKVGSAETTEFVDQIKNLGFRYATTSGTTIAVSDITVPEEKKAILDKINAEVAEVERAVPPRSAHRRRAVQQTIELWQQATEPRGRRGQEESGSADAAQRDGEVRRDQRRLPADHASWPACAA